jgi:hypothetical protein
VRGARGSSATTHDDNTQIFKPWIVNGAILDPQAAEDHIDNLLTQSKSRLLRDENGKYYLSSYDATAAVSYSDFKFEKDSNIARINISRTPISSIFNTVRVAYHKNYATGDFEKETFIECIKTYPGSRLAEALDATEYEIDVDDGTHFAAGDLILIDDEVLLIDSIVSNTLTVANAGGNRTPQKGSTAIAHDDNTQIFKLVTNSDDGTGTQDQNTTDPDDREDEAIAVIYKYHQNRELAVEADMISDDTTAQNLREHLFDYYSRPHYIVEIDCFLNVSNLKVTDIIEFDDSVMDTFLKLGGESWASKKFEVINVRRRGVMDYTIRAVEL